MKKRDLHANKEATSRCGAEYSSTTRVVVVLVAPLVVFCPVAGASVVPITPLYSVESSGGQPGFTYSSGHYGKRFFGWLTTTPRTVL